MYKVIGADQKEYGPVSVEQINNWIAQGRANGSSRIQADGSEEWKPLREFPEFAEALAAVTNAGIHAPMPAASSANLQPARTSRLGIWSMLGIMTLGLLFAAMLLPVSRGTKGGPGITCINNTKQICLALMIYASDNSNQLPAKAWCDSIMTYAMSPKVFQCPGADPNQRSHFAFNARLQGLRDDQLLSPATTVLLFETDGGWNLSGGPELLPRKPHHDKNVVVGFADGHVEMVTPARLQSLQWTPKLAGQ